MKKVEFKGKHKITGTALKNICVMCYKEDGNEEKVDAVCFPFSKFGTSGYFCDKHAEEILKNNKLKEFEKVWSL